MRTRPLVHIFAFLVIGASLTGGYNTAWAGDGTFVCSTSVDGTGQGSSDSFGVGISSAAKYREFLNALDRPQDTDPSFPQRVVERHLDAMTAVLPDELRERLAIEDAIEKETASALADSAGHRLARWWGRRDPYPATEHNERLQEHLDRTAKAFRRYSREDSDRRLDDRGKVYVRYGPPDRRRTIEAGKCAEFWVYASHDAAEFLFVRDRGDGYEFGSPTDILPDGLRYGFGPTDRGTGKSVRSLNLLEKVYLRLAHFRSRYGIVLSDLSMYNEQVRQARSGLPTGIQTPPHAFVTQKMEEIKTLEAEERRRKEEVLPRTESTVADRVEDLPLATRWVRSLQPDGSTEVSLYWSFLRTSLTPSQKVIDSLKKRKVDRGDGYLLTSSLVELSPSYATKERRTDHLFVPTQDETGGRVKTQEEAFRLGETPHAALQVDAAWASVDRDEDVVSKNATVKIGTSRADSLAPLHNEPDNVEMSDLTPVRMVDTTSLERAPVYPFRRVSPDMALGLRFEIYHLDTDPDGQTRYTVEYVVRRERERTGLGKLFRDEGDPETSVRSTVTGTKNRVTEYVLLDPASWSEDAAQDITVSVRVTDERTGQSVTRSVDFEMPSRTE